MKLAGIFLLTCDIALSKLVGKLSNFLSASFIKFTSYNFLHYSHRLRSYIYIQHTNLLISFKKIIVQQVCLLFA